jgi:nicotinamidase-related amidase
MSNSPTTALLIMDMQRGVVPRIPGADALAVSLAATIEGARDAGVMIIFVAAGYLPGHPEIGPRSTMTQLKETNAFVIGDPATELAEPLAALTGDVIVTKKRFSAFSGSELETILRAHNITRLACAGIVTSGVVLSTVREASDRDYELVVLSDGCLDYDAEVHRVLTEKVFPRQAKVTRSSDWLESL